MEGIIVMVDITTLITLKEQKESKKEYKKTYYFD